MGEGTHDVNPCDPAHERPEWRHLWLAVIGVLANGGPDGGFGV